MHSTGQNAEEPKPTFNMEQMDAFLHNLQQATDSSNRWLDRRRLLWDFREQDPPSVNGNLIQQQLSSG